MCDSYIVSTSWAGYCAWLMERCELNRKQLTLHVMSADTQTKGTYNFWYTSFTAAYQDYR